MTTEDATSVLCDLCVETQHSEHYYSEELLRAKLAAYSVEVNSAEKWKKRAEVADRTVEELRARILKEVEWAENRRYAFILADKIRAALASLKTPSDEEE